MCVSRVKHVFLSLPKVDSPCHSLVSPLVLQIVAASWRGNAHVKEISRTSTSSYDHLLKSLIVPISAVTSFGKTVYPLGFSTSTSPLSDIVHLCADKRVDYGVQEVILGDVTEEAA